MTANKAKARSKARLARQTSCEASVHEEVEAGSSVELETCMDTLLFAVAELNVENIKEFIAKGCDLNDTPVRGCTPLLLAIKMQSCQIVKLLVENGACCCTSDHNGMTALHHAAVNGLVDALKCIVDVGRAPYDQRNLAGCTPLYQTAQHGHIDCVRAFLDMGADIEARTKTGATPLYIACDRGHARVAEVLLDAGADADVSTELKMTPLLVAAFNGHCGVVRSLLARGVDVEQRGLCQGTALYVVAQENRLDVANLLLEHGANVDARCDGELTPSLIAAMQGHSDMVRLLLESRGDIGVCTKKGSTLAIMAARHGQVDVLKVLVEIGGAQVLDGQDDEGLSALEASKKTKQVDATSYIKRVASVRKEADLSAWEASLPHLLLELDPPSKKKAKSKPKRKGKSDEGNPSGKSSFATGGAALRLDDTPDVAGVTGSDHHTVDPREDARTMKVDETPLSRTSSRAGKCEVEADETPMSRTSSRTGKLEVEADDTPMSRTSSRTRTSPTIATAPIGSPPSLAPLLSPAGTLTTPSSLTPMSAASSTPCGGPFALRTVLPPWPPTPETWPQRQDGLFPCLWPALPPPVDLSAATALAYSFASSTVDSLPLQPVRSTPDMLEDCQSVFVAPFWQRDTVELTV